MDEQIKSKSRFRLFIETTFISHPMMFAIVVTVLLMLLTSCGDTAKAEEMIERYEDGAEDAIEDFYTHYAADNVRFTISDITTVLETYVYPNCGSGTIFYTSPTELSSSPRLIAYFYPQSGMGAPNNYLVTDANEESGYSRKLQGLYPDSTSKDTGKFAGAIVSKSPIPTNILDEYGFFSYYVLFMNGRDYWLYRINLYYDSNKTNGAYAESFDFYVYARPLSSISGAPSVYQEVSRAAGASSTRPGFGNFVPNSNGQDVVIVSLGDTYYNTVGLDGSNGTYYNSYYSYNDLIEDSYPEQLGLITAEVTNDTGISGFEGSDYYRLEGSINQVPTNISSIPEYQFTFYGQDEQFFVVTDKDLQAIKDSFPSDSSQYADTYFSYLTGNIPKYFFSITAESLPQMIITRIKFDATVILSDEVTEYEIHYDVDGFNLNLTSVGGLNLMDYTPVADRDLIDDEDILELEVMFQQYNNDTIDMNGYVQTLPDFSEYPFNVNLIHIRLTDVEGTWIYGDYEPSLSNVFTLQDFLYDNAFVGFYDVVVFDLYEYGAFPNPNGLSTFVGYMVYYTELFQVKYTNKYNSEILDNLVTDAYYTKATYNYLTTVFDDFEDKTLKGFNQLIGYDITFKSLLDDLYDAIKDILDILEELNLKIPEFDPQDLYDKLDDILEALTATDDGFNEDDTVAEAIFYYLNNIEQTRSLDDLPSATVFADNKMSIWAAGKVHNWLEGTPEDSPSYFTLTIFESITDAWEHLTDYADLQDSVITVLSGFSTSVTDASSYTNYISDYVEMYQSDFDISLRNPLEVVE